jgi:hypothetical protein
MSEIRYREQALDAIARKTLKEYDSSLLLACPRAVPIEDIIENYFKFTIEYQFLRKNGRILGETIFDDTYVPIYDMEKEEYTVILVKGGTIIIDAGLLKCRGDGRLRFTCAHELAHWLIHRELYIGSGEAAAMTKAKKSSDDDNIIERQADMLSSSLLMPIGQVKIAFNRIRMQKPVNDVIQELSNMFQVSKQAMEIRLRTHNLI